MRLLCVIFMSLSSCCVQAATIYSESTSRAHVQAAIDAASDGDTVVIPAGSSTWSEVVTVSKSITVQGAGVGATVITNDQGTGSVPNNTQYLTMQVTAGDEGRFRLTGIEFWGNQTANGIYVSGGATKEMQIDNCKFSEFRGRAISIFSLGKVLVYGNYLLNCSKTIDTYAGTTLQNESWSTPLTLGTIQCAVIEDNIIEYSSDSWMSGSQATASHGLGGRSTWRHNAWSNNKVGMNFFPILDCHGNQEAVSGQDPDEEPPGGTGNHRATRQVEYYNNTHINNGGATSGTRLTHLRGGTTLFYNNSWSGNANFETSFYMQEEDGPSRYDRLTDYPGHDPHRAWFHNNDLNGSPMLSFSTTDSSDLTFIIEGVNVFFYQRPGYTPLQYPHPWRSTVRRITTPTATVGTLTSQ